MLVAQIVGGIVIYTIIGLPFVRWAWKDEAKRGTDRRTMKEALPLAIVFWPFFAVILITKSIAAPRMMKPR